MRKPKNHPESGRARLLLAAPPAALFLAIHGHDLLLYAGGRPQAADLVAAAVGLALVALPVAGLDRRPAWFWSWLGHALLVVVGTAFYAGLVVGSLALIQLRPLSLETWQQIPWQLSPVAGLATVLVAGGLAFIAPARAAGSSLALLGFVCAVGLAALSDGIPFPTRYLVTGAFAVAGTIALLAVERAPADSRRIATALAGTLLLALYLVPRLSYPLPLLNRLPLLAVCLLWPAGVAACLWARALLLRRSG